MQEGTRPTVDVSIGVEKEEGVLVAEDGRDDIPIGQAAEAPDDDELMGMDEGSPELIDADDDVGPAAPYEPESESDTDSDGEDVGAAEPPATRPREI